MNTEAMIIDASRAKEGLGSTMPLPSAPWRELGTTTWSLFPAFRGVRAVMARRLLINFRVRTECAVRWLPRPFQPRTLHGWALAGICLIRLEHARPSGAPWWMGISSENAAHRVAVEWTEGTAKREGVYVPCRHTDSLLNRAVGGRCFPGVHQHAQFRVDVSRDCFEIDMRGVGDSEHVFVRARVADRLPEDSVLQSVEMAARFFQSGSCGWSPGRRRGTFDGVRLKAEDWDLIPLEVERVESSVFSDAVRFPRGSVEFDSAFLMRGIEHEWVALDNLSSKTFSPVRSGHCARTFFEMP